MATEPRDLLPMTQSCGCGCGCTDATVTLTPIHIDSPHPGQDAFLDDAGRVVLRDWPIYRPFPPPAATPDPLR
jgi:hypothetical protein